MLKRNSLMFSISFFAQYVYILQVRDSNDLRSCGETSQLEPRHFSVSLCLSLASNLRAETFPFPEKQLTVSQPVNAYSPSSPVELSWPNTSAAFLTSTYSLRVFVQLFIKREHSNCDENAMPLTRTYVSTDTITAAVIPDLAQCFA